MQNEDSQGAKAPVIPFKDKNKATIFYISLSISLYSSSSLSLSLSPYLSLSLSPSLSLSLFISLPSHSLFISLPSHSLFISLSLYCSGVQSKQKVRERDEEREGGRER